MKLKIILITIITIYLSSCRPMYRTLLGVDSTPKWIYSNKELKKEERKMKVQGDFLFELDTTKYSDTILSIYKSNVSDFKSTFPEDTNGLKMIRKVANDDVQAVQFRLFDKKGDEIFKLVNCYIEILPIDWNYEKCLETFPPKTKNKQLNTHQFNLELILKSLKQDITLSQLPKTNYYAVIFWNSFMIRPSKKLIAQLDNYYGLNHPEVTYIYINNHNAQIWSHTTSEQKNMITNHPKF